MPTGFTTLVLLELGNSVRVRGETMVEGRAAELVLTVMEWAHRRDGGCNESHQ
jgi:hypothetical protein